MFSNKVVEIGVWWELCTHNYYYLPRLNVNQNKAILQGVVYVCMSFTLVPFRLTKFCFGQNVWMCCVKWVMMKQIVNKLNELLNEFSNPWTYSDISSNESSRFRWVVKWIFNQNFQTNLISQGPSVSCRLLELWPSLEWDAALQERKKKK